MKNNEFSGFNFFIIILISILYILLVTKFAEIISNSYEDEYDQLGTYVMIIYFISIMGIIVGYVWLNNKKDSSNKTADLITKWSLTIGGVILLIYTILYYWDYLGDYSKLLLIVLSITTIIYYLYKFA